MKMDYRLIKRIRWGLLLLLAVIPCLFLPDIFSNIKIEALLRNNNLYSLVRFTYAEDKTVRCFKENPDDLEGIGYVFLPSYADMDEIEVDILAGRYARKPGTLHLTEISWNMWTDIVPRTGSGRV